MISKFQQILLLIAFLVFLTPNFISAQTPVLPSFPVALPNCTDRCGDISIPYPFGITQDCSRNISYRVTCNESSNGPTLLLGNSNIPILEISLTGQLRVMKRVARECYFGGRVSDVFENTITLSLPMTINNTANQFVVVGCDSYGIMSGQRSGGQYYSTGCISTCRQLEDTEDGICAGTGCCQITNIPNDVSTLTMALGTFNNHTSVSGFNNCSFGLIVEERSFTFYRENLTNLRDVERLPLVVDWAIGTNETCASAQLDSDSYACRSPNSECYIPDNGDGYRCRCSSGYQGNPYLDRGCQVPSYPLALQPLPNCTDRCGNISIPFPFGTMENCYRNITYLVTCNETSSPPELFLGNVRILEILLTGELRVMKRVATECYSGGEVTNAFENTLTLSRSMAISNTTNRFTIVGCDSYGYMSGRRLGGQYYSTGCISTCRELEDTEDGICAGTGCCQITNIPNDVRTLGLELGSFRNHRNVSGFNNCTFGFIAEESSFTFYRQNLTNLRNVERLPLVIDWAIGTDETCEVARLDADSYACRSPLSECVIPTNGNGYRCQCISGYEGNPYLDTGCQDINECGSTRLNNCSYTCENYPGNFNCTCPHGYLVSGTNCTCPEGYRAINASRISEGGCIRISRGESQVFRAIAGAAVGIVIVILAACLVNFELKRRRLKKMKQIYFLRNGGKLLEEKLTATGNMMSISTERETRSNNDVAKIYSSSELNHATKNFHDELIVGQGGFGTVYKGFLPDNRIVAVKKSKEVDLGQIDQFINEVVVLSRVSHRHIVKLLGCCLETQAPLLVYEFITNGTLHDHLHDESRKRFLDWNMRLRIAAETADVLSYLHSAASIPIIHRDVKSANILLDQNFEAKVSDFGASRLVPVDQTQLSTMVQGTFGYLDPEYMQTNQLTEKSDVYSFGVVLLELLTGMTPLSYDRPEEERNLTSFFLCRLQQGRLLEVLDETIVSEKANLEQVTEVANLARVCLNVKGHDRPSMKQVAMELEGLRSGGKQSWATPEGNHALGRQPSYSHILEDDFENESGFSTSIASNSLNDPNKLKGGR